MGLNVYIGRNRNTLANGDAMANSISDAIGASAEAAVGAIGFIVPGSPDPGTAVPVVRRKTPSAPQGASQPLPQIVVSVGAEAPTRYLSATKKLRSFALAVTVVTGTGQHSADDAMVRQWREQIDAALDTKTAFENVPGFNRVTARGGAPFDAAGLSKDYNYSISAYTVEVLVPRSE